MKARIADLIRKLFGQWLVFFLLMCFVVTCCMVLFITLFSETAGIRLTDDMIGSAAGLTFLNVVLLSVICTAIDLVFDKYDYWFGYVVGALIVTWVISVLPVLKITPPVVTGVICFASIILYVAYIAGKTGHLNWLSKFLLPMLILTAAFIAMDSALIGGKKVKGIHILSLLSAEAAAFFICLEATLDNWAVGSVDLKWSLIIACGFISVIAVFEAFSYVGRINRK